MVRAGHTGRSGGIALRRCVCVAGCFVGASCCWRHFFHSRYDSAYSRTHPRGSAGYVPTNFTMDIPHEAIDILAPRGTPVLAVVSGTVRKLFLSKPGGNTIYQFDEMGVYCYYYAHLDRYAKGLREGMRVERGEIIGFVGSTGNAIPAHAAPAFCDLRLGPERLWWKGKAIDPYPGLVAAVKRAR